MLSIIPVMDILQGYVVHGKKGERSEYQPITTISKLTDSSDPLIVAEILDPFGAESMYVADLDSILQTGKNNYSTFRKIAQELSLNLLVDGGFRKATDPQMLLNQSEITAIFGTETLESYKELERAITEWGPDRIIPSLDLRDGQVMSHIPEIKKVSPLTILGRFETLGVKRVIMLELTTVGSQSSSIPNSIKLAIKNTNIDIISGGGTKIPEDIENWHGAGVKGLLIATAFHTGQITLKSIKKLRKRKIIA